MTYLAAVSNATQSNMSGLSWFKIYEDVSFLRSSSTLDMTLDIGLQGYNPSTQKWAVDKMIANKVHQITSCTELPLRATFRDS